MIHVLASITVRKGCLVEFLDIFKANIPAVLGEKGCVEYIPAIDVNSSLPSQKVDENIVTIIEKWQCLEHLQTHLTAPHMLVYREKVAALVEKVSMKVLENA